MLQGIGMSSCLVSLSHLFRLSADLPICLWPKYFPKWAHLNQFCSSLSTNTSISLRLKYSGFLLASLETFNTEGIFIKSQAQAKSFLHLGRNYPSSVSKTLQSECRALRIFYQTPLLRLCIVLCHVYEKTLK